MRVLLTVLLFFGIAIQAWGNACKPLAGKALKIGCTFGCDWENYRKAVEEAAAAMGVKAELVRLSKPEDLALVDGFFSPGGHDIAPSHYADNPALPEKKRKRLHELFACYGNVSKFEKGLCFTDTKNCKCPAKDDEGVYLERDDLEIRIFREHAMNAAYKRTPALGVCYGWQAMAVASGLPLAPHLPAENISDTRAYFELDKEGKRPDRLIEFELGGQLSQFVSKTKRPVVNTNHHQGVLVDDMKYQDKKIKPFKVIATHGKKSKVVYVAERTTPPTLGIQFHAERSKDEIRLAPYRWLISRSCENHLIREAKSKKK